MREMYRPDRRERCRNCHFLRLRRTAERAREMGLDAFTTTLLGSPHQDHELLRESGERAAEEAGVSFLYRDFRPLHEQFARGRAAPAALPAAVLRLLLQRIRAVPRYDAGAVSRLRTEEGGVKNAECRSAEVRGIGCGVDRAARLRLCALRFAFCVLDVCDRRLPAPAEDGASECRPPPPAAAGAGAADRRRRRRRRLPAAGPAGAAGDHHAAEVRRGRRWCGSGFPTPRPRRRFPARGRVAWWRFPASRRSASPACGGEGRPSSRAASGSASRL